MKLLIKYCWLCEKLKIFFIVKSSGMDILLIELNGTFYLENNNNVLSANKKIEPCDFFTS